jgi:SNF2 family DNA or RNA helicase
VPRAELNTAKNRIDITTTYIDREQVSQLPGARYDRTDKIWTGPISWATCIILRGLFGEDLDVGPELHKWTWNEYTQRINPAMHLRDALSSDKFFPVLDDVERNSTLKLYPYQRVDVRFLALNKRALLAQPPGLGKSAVTVRTLQVMNARELRPFPALVVCPNSLKYTVWAKEFQRWAPEIPVQVIDGSAVKRRKQLAEQASIFVLNWEGLKLHSKLTKYGTLELSEKDRAAKELNEMGLRTVVFDEVHRMRDPHSQQTRAAWTLAHNAEHCFGLTGTPIGDNIGDLWSIMHAIEKDWFPRRTKFLDRYAKTSLNYFGGHEILGIKPETKKELFQITDPLMRRVPKSAALPQLPPKLPVQYRHTPMTVKQAKAYKEMEETMIARLNEILVAPSPLSALTRLLQFASSSAEIDEKGKVRLSVPSPKIDDMVELLDEMGEEPLVVAAVSRQLIELAAERLAKLKIPHGLITGAQGSALRAQAVDDFQDGKTRVMLMTIGAGAEGITLTRADTMLFLQRDWSEIKNAQSEDRVHRIGSEIHSCVRIIDQITPGTVEERKVELLKVKQGRMEELVRDEQSLLKLLGALK